MKTSYECAPYLPGTDYLVVKDVSEDGGVAEEGVDLKWVGHVEGEERHEDAARRHHHRQTSCSIERKVGHSRRHELFQF